MVLTRKNELPDLKEIVFSKVDSYDVFKMYVSGFGLKKKMKSPIRTDKHEGSWGVFQIEDKLMYKDFATGESGDCVKLVCQMFGITYKEALKKIAQDFGILNGTEEYKQIINSYSKPEIGQKQYTLIQCVTKKFTAADREYWNMYKISTDELKEFEVYSLKEVYINRIKQPIGKEELVYGYLFQGNHWKIYRPYSTTDKWRNNLPLTMMHGLENIKDADKTVVTKSLKDEICIKKWLPTVCSVQNESKQSISEESIKYLQNNSKEVLVNFDNDSVGVEACKHYNSYGFKWLNVPKNIPIPGTDKVCKDYSDWLRYYGEEIVIEHLKEKMVI